MTAARLRTVPTVGGSSLARVIIEEIRVLNYRSIRTQQTVPLAQGAVLVGPNNVGKSNLLRAVDLFFHATDGGAPYDIDVDKPHRSSGRTSLRALFRLESGDEGLWDDYSGLYAMLQDPPAVDEGIVPIYLEFSRAGNPSYKLFPNSRAPREKQADFSRRQQQFVQNVLERFSVRYVPSAKHWGSFYDKFLVPALGEVVEEAIREELDGVRQALRSISASLSSLLQASLGTSVEVEMDLAPNLSELLGAVAIGMSDPIPTDLSGKGQGIQSAFLVAAVGWISEREHAAGRTPVWLIEEPEAYTHPSLARAMVQLVDAARSYGPVVFTTHSLGLVPPDVTLVRGVTYQSSTGTVVQEYSTHAEATKTLREALGVKAADYFGFGSGVVAVEGRSDRELLAWYLQHCAEGEFPALRETVLHDFGGVKQLSGFLAGTLGVLQREVPVVALFDGDDAGMKEVRALSRRFSNSNVRWTPGLDYVTLPVSRSIEGLFPEEWIRDLDDEHPEWFEERPTFDMDGRLIGFRLRDQSKRSAAAWLQARGEEAPDALGGFRRLLEALEDALIRQRELLDDDV